MIAKTGKPMVKVMAPDAQATVDFLAQALAFTATVRGNSGCWCVGNGLPAGRLPDCFQAAHSPRRSS